jgi:hypothetical protein
MAVKSWGSQRGSQSAVEEIFFQNDDVSLCLLLNRRAKTMRVVDFRAGPSNAKRLFVMSLAQREGAEKVFTLVERDEVATWIKLGFAKEGNIPGFYKRSDAFMLGALAKSPRDVGALPAFSEVRMRVPVGAGAFGSFNNASLSNDDVDHAEPRERDEPVATPAHDRMERTIVHAKKHAKELAGTPMPLAKIGLLRDVDAQKAVEKAAKGGRALTAFEPFGRDVQRSFFMVTARGGFELVASTEQQSCFGNAFLELLTAPRDDAERLATMSALRVICDKLLASGVVSCFALAPSDDVRMATAFVSNGFRRTGLLQSHIVVGGERKDAIIWSRKLANPADE